MMCCEADSEQGGLVEKLMALADWVERVAAGECEIEIDFTKEEDEDDEPWWSNKTKIDRGEFTFYDEGDDMYDYDGEFLDY